MKSEMIPIGIFCSLLLEGFCNVLYESFRPLIINMTHMETLAELCNILKVILHNLFRTGLRGSVATVLGYREIDGKYLEGQLLQLQA